MSFTPSSSHPCSPQAVNAAQVKAQVNAAQGAATENVDGDGSSTCFMWLNGLSVQLDSVHSVIVTASVNFLACLPWLRAS
jgi:hypothetical protein